MRPLRVAKLRDLPTGTVILHPDSPLQAGAILPGFVQSPLFIGIRSVDFISIIDWIDDSRECSVIAEARAVLSTVDSLHSGALFKLNGALAQRLTVHDHPDLCSEVAFRRVFREDGDPVGDDTGVPVLYRQGDVPSLLRPSTVVTDISRWYERGADDAHGWTLRRRVRRATPAVGISA